MWKRTAARPYESRPTAETNTMPQPSGWGAVFLSREKNATAA
jgi:hypothetical protein